jgi:uncharacterized protein YceK
MAMIGRYSGFIAVVIVALVSGCASVPMATTEQDSAAKTFVTKPGKANIYVYRNESMGQAIKMPVALDGRLVGDTAARTYLLLEVDPGRHTLVSKTENDSILQVDAAAGKNYFVWQEVKMGMFAARSMLQLVDETAGKAAVAECKLIEVVR